jgi:hypothetical protein
MIPSSDLLSQILNKIIAISCVIYLPKFTSITVESYICISPATLPVTDIIIYTCLVITQSCVYVQIIALALVTGWGRVSENGEFAHVLQKVRLPLIAVDDCLNLYNNAGYGDYVSQCVICGGGTPEYEADSCQVHTYNIII